MRRGCIGPKPQSYVPARGRSRRVGGKSGTEVGYPHTLKNVRASPADRVPLQRFREHGRRRETSSRTSCWNGYGVGMEGVEDDAKSGDENEGETGGCTREERRENSGLEYQGGKNNADARPAPFAARVQTQETIEYLTVSTPNRKGRGNAHLDASSAESPLSSSSDGPGCVACARPTKARRLWCGNAPKSANAYISTNRGARPVGHDRARATKLIQKSNDSTRRRTGGHAVAGTRPK
ncbi:hypothetical protein B0H14DRAFT_2648994 [Mycena olivaceomarginata]|nr:hypothetical protein B0H14DRAFT_2648994 [Mycena olivaceomarginata]